MDDDLDYALVELYRFEDVAFAVPERMVRVGWVFDQIWKSIKWRDRVKIEADAPPCTAGEELSLDVRAPVRRAWKVYISEKPYCWVGILPAPVDFTTAMVVAQSFVAGFIASERALLARIPDGGSVTVSLGTVKIANPG